MVRVLQLSFVITLIGVLAGPLYSQEFFSGGQRPRFNVISRRDGLPNNSVSSIQQDTRGFMWMGTQGGLVRYDGRTFTTYNNQPFQRDSLPHDLVQTVYYDEIDDVLWVGTYNGLARFRPGESGFRSYSHVPGDVTSLSDDVVIAVSRGPEGKLWVGTQSGLNRMREDGSFERIEVGAEVIRDLHLDSQGVLWIASHAGLGRWDPGADTVIPVDADLPSPYLMAIDEIEPGVLLLGTWGLGEYPGGLAVYRQADGSVETRQFSNNTIYTVLAASDGTIWAGSWGGGLFALDRSGTVYEFTPETEPNLSTAVMYSLYEDEAGVIWVGTNGGGLHLLSPRQRNFRLYYHDVDRPGSLPPGKINVLFRDRDGILWAGMYGSGLAFYDVVEERWHTYRADPDDPFALANDIVVRIHADAQGRMWVATNEGLQIFDKETERFLTFGRHVYPEAMLSGEIVYAVTHDSRGDLWIGTYRSGVTRFNPSTGESVVYRYDPANPHSVSDDHIYDIFEDSSGDVWIGTNGGLSRYRRDRDDFQVYRHDPDDRSGLSNNTIRVMYEDSQSRLWIGTVSGGLNRYVRRTDTFEHLTLEDGLSDNTVLGILEGDDGRLWLATQQGLSVYDTRTDYVEVLDERDGLMGSEFQSGHWRDPDGTLLFGGGHGITRIDSSVSTRNTHPPPVQITDVQVFQESIDPDAMSYNERIITLAPGDSFVSFEFVGLDYEAAESNVYSYRLRGFDGGWIFSGNRNYATYTNLPPGRYQFQVQAANADGQWTPRPATLDLIVLSPWYARWWAIVLYAVAAVAVAFGVWRMWRARALADKNRELELAVSQLARANRELERLSVHDALTGLFNRRYFDTNLAETWNRAARSRRPLALLMADVDHFKRYNDTFGHVAGDRALETVARLMLEQLPRSTDFVARYGGEEFALLLYDTPYAGALQVAERVRTTIEQEVPERGLKPVTISIGVAVTVPSGDREEARLLTAADAALYAAKRNGRNRVESAAE